MSAPSNPRRAARRFRRVHYVKLLLDTHTILWCLDGSPQLSPPARSLVEDGTSGVATDGRHALTCWEALTC